MFESLSRFFSISFAARIELSLKLIYIFNNLKLKEEE